MEPATLLVLRQLQQSPSSSDFGKICQSLLAVVLRQGGFDHVVNRLVEGVDVDASGNLGRFAIEVKTTAGREIIIADKDIKGWNERSQDGYAPVLGVLKISLLSEWSLCDAIGLPKGTHRTQRLRLDEVAALTQIANARFDAVAQKHIPEILGLADGSPLHYLNELLKKTGVDSRD